MLTSRLMDGLADPGPRNMSPLSLLGVRLPLLLRRFPAPLQLSEPEMLAAGKEIVGIHVDDHAERELHIRDLEVAAKSWDLARPAYAIDKYVGGELDFETPGQRGYGRVDEFPPRFGAYHRERMRRLSLAERATLRDQMIAVMLSTYIGACTFLKPPEHDVVLTPEEYFQSWIRKLYVSTIGQPYRDIGRWCGQEYDAALDDVLSRLGLRGGFLGFLDKTPLIVSYLSFGGWGLRLVEVDPRSASEDAIARSSANPGEM